MRGRKPGAKSDHGTGSALTNWGAAPLYPNIVGQSPTQGKATDWIQRAQPQARLKNKHEGPLRDSYSTTQKRGSIVGLIL